ncbi:leucine-rich_repeat domain-containing protein [Hexamita inflata]|uniref:Leucine-rich repeat domain-containing protein n=1 Tax=Hexamita inflata TaxID=28002 RepID=A0AA86UBR0_9EUKA|nr:leucine-rich repeat domain-containing protein [Hexamita inflata]
MGVCYQDVNQQKPSEAKQSQNTNYYQNPSIIEYQVQQPIDQHKNENRYDQYMIKKYKNIISDNSLHLMKKKLKTIKFVENFDIKGLILDQCSDFHLQRVPTNIILLVIRDCKLNDVTGIKQMSQLQELDLSFNSIQNVNELSSLVKLVRLNLSHNILKSFPPLQGLKQLKYLYCNKNIISNLSGIQKLTNLTKLDLRFNRIFDISALQSLKSLKILYLSENKINNISSLQELTNLQVLDLARNDIVDLSALHSLNNIKQLYLFINQIVDISPLANLTNIQELNVTYNFITDFSPICKHANHNNYIIKNQSSPTKNLIKLSGVIQKVIKILNNASQKLSQAKQSRQQLLIKEQVQTLKINSSLTKALQNSILFTSKVASMFIQVTNDFENDCQ